MKSSEAAGVVAMTPGTPSTTFGRVADSIAPTGWPPPGLRDADLAGTVAWLASLQLATGMIPWYPGGHADPWNHTEAIMALAAGGRWREVDAGFAWLASTQLPDGSWCWYHVPGGVEDPRRDPNAAAYVATGAWWVYRHDGDRTRLQERWGMVEGAVEFALRLQRPGGEVAWNLDADGVVGVTALLSASSSIAHSLRCALAIAALLGYERPHWARALARLAAAVASAAAPAQLGRPAAFVAKDRWAMDWYYPVLSGALDRSAARRRLARRWDDFVIEGRGTRCVADHPWVTAAETAELAMALDAAGLTGAAREVLGWTGHLRDHDGAYWTGRVHPAGGTFPPGERASYGAAAVVMARSVLADEGPVAGWFRPSAWTVAPVPGTPSPPFA